MLARCCVYSAYIFFAILIKFRKFSIDSSLWIMQFHLFNEINEGAAIFAMVWRFKVQQFRSKLCHWPERCKNHCSEKAQKYCSHTNTCGPFNSIVCGLECQIENKTNMPWTFSILLQIFPFRFHMLHFIHKKILQFNIWSS